jgi:hypothetical protein
MTSATLYREGSDLDALLADLDAEHPGAVRVVDIVHAREGGVLGFFARPVVGVHYELSEAALSTDAEQPSARQAPPGGDVLDELIQAAEADDVRVESGPAAKEAPQLGPDLEGPNAEFARLLLELAAQKSALRAATDSIAAEPVAAPPAPPAASAPAPAPRPAPAPLPEITPAAADVPMIKAEQPASRQPHRPLDQRGRERKPQTDLGLRRALAEVGVPIARIPVDAAHKYGAVETLVAQLPDAPALPNGAGALIVIAGPAHAITAAAETARARLHLRADDVWTAGCPVKGSIDDPWDASIAAAAHRLSAERAAVVAVATDTHGIAWANEVIGELRPDAVWLHVDATRKPSDTRTIAAALPAPDALVVDGAAQTASPASVWELDLPIALLDGTAPTRSAWAVLLLERLAALGV